MWTLFWTFVKIGCLSFGGGYAIMPVIEYETAAHGWMNAAQFHELVSLAAMAPGPIAVNSATLIGYEISGIAGALVATSGMALPSLVIMAVLSLVLARGAELPLVRKVLYGLRPVVAGLIAYAGLRMLLPSASAGIGSWTFLGTLAIAAGCFVAMVKFRLHPLPVMIGSAIAGIVLF